MRRLALALCVAASPVVAQDLVFSIAATEACLEEAVGAAERRACIGSSARLCMDATPGGNSTLGMIGCLDQEAQYWDRRLNETYRVLRAQTRQVDAEAPDFAPSLADALREMQRAWIIFRDTTCAYEVAQWGGGSGGGPARLGCLMRQSGAQSLYLEETLFQ